MKFYSGRVIEYQGRLYEAHFTVGGNLEVRGDIPPETEIKHFFSITPRVRVRGVECNIELINGQKLTVSIANCVDNQGAVERLKEFDLTRPDPLTWRFDVDFEDCEELYIKKVGSKRHIVYGDKIDILKTLEDLCNYVERGQNTTTILSLT